MGMMATPLAEGRFRTIEVEQGGDRVSVRLNRPQASNSIDATMLAELHELLDALDSTDVRVLVIRGDENAFCTGMDLRAYTARVAEGRQNPADESGQIAEMTQSYMRLLRRMSLHRCIVISLIEGRVLAGGVGIVAASDYAIACEKTTFSLSEVMWGLLPSMVIPYLIRRVGHQPAYRMTMLGSPVEAHQAATIHLVDECVASEELERTLARVLRHLDRMHAPVAPLMKRYFREMSGITDDIEDYAVRTTAERSQDESVKANIANFTRHGRFPWASA